MVKQTSEISIPPIRAVHMSLFPTYDTLDEAIGRACLTLPIKSRNELFVALMAYHNTLLKVINGSGNVNQG